MEVKRFRNQFAENIFRTKYAQGPNDGWDNLAERVVEDICGKRGVEDRQLMCDSDIHALKQAIKEQKFIPGGRYLYYAGRPARFYNNCYLLRADEDTREEWSAVTWRAMSCLMTGGGIGIDYSTIRPSGRILSRTGGKASGPISLMHTINEVGRNVMQGGSRRSAIYASLDREHEDVQQFLTVKNWNSKAVQGTNANLGDLKRADFNFSCPLDMTNISVNYGDTWLNLPNKEKDPIFLANVKQAMSTGEPGFSFNFGAKSRETLRNACTEVTSEDDSDVCNLGSGNMANISLTLVILYLLALPVLLSYAANGLLVTWTLPGFTSVFAGFLSALQALFVAVGGVVLAGVSAGIAWKLGRRRRAAGAG